MEHLMIRPQIRRKPGKTKDLDAILSRLETRQQAPRVFAPDFLHGDFTLEEVYANDLGGRVESCGFVLLTPEGVFLAKLEDHFLTIFHHDKDMACLSWLSSLGQELSAWVVYDLCDRGGEGDVEWHRLPGQVSTLELGWSDFLDAESRILNVWRDDVEQSSSMRRKHEATLLSMIGILVRNANLGGLPGLDVAA